MPRSSEDVTATRATAAALKRLKRSDIDVVMADAAPLVEVRHTLRQIVNVKGD